MMVVMSSLFLGCDEVRWAGQLHAPDAATSSPVAVPSLPIHTGGLPARLPVQVASQLEDPFFLLPLADMARRSVNDIRRYARSGC